MCACPACPKGALPAMYTKDSTYKPTGKDITLGSAKVYVTGDPSWKTAVIVMHDVFGPEGGHHKALCDALAAGGHYVVSACVLACARVVSIVPFADDTPTTR